MTTTDPRFRHLSPFERVNTPVVVEQARSTRVASPASRAYRLQLTRIGKLQSQLAELDAMAHAHRLATHEQIVPLQQERQDLMRALAKRVDERLSGKTLSAPQRRAAVAVLCALTSALAQGGDKAMAALHDKHAPQTLAELESERHQALRAQLEAALGEQLQDMPAGMGEKEWLATGLARWREQQEAKAQARKEATARKKAKRQPAKAQVQAELVQQDAEGLLRSLFRQLASALHPDREPDPQARVHKTALMGEANAAYALKDLVALMRLQQQVALAPRVDGQELADDKLAAMTVLLKQQVAELERERVRRHDALGHEFEVPPGMGVTPKALQMLRLEQQAALEAALALMRDDLRRSQSDAGFLRWVNEQRRATERLAGLGLGEA